MEQVKRKWNRLKRKWSKLKDYLLLVDRSFRASEALCCVGGLVRYVRRALQGLREVGGLGADGG
ncbi:hypothetical protein BVG16_26215 [Paenibacillus selenitireducens]|uniref:Uncharacterized protein n=1 Tax=Paenibacillus selenitireducens TaxID=1324314 RepID=A0A1T2X249_9BACL|nr:hypothetical protein BVG16_26215 [Paenibacillus selenitireducens]